MAMLPFCWNLSEMLRLWSRNKLKTNRLILIRQSISISYHVIIPLWNNFVIIPLWTNFSTKLGNSLLGISYSLWWDFYRFLRNPLEILLFQREPRTPFREGELPLARSLRKIDGQSPEKCLTFLQTKIPPAKNHPHLNILWPLMMLGWSTPGMPFVAWNKMKCRFLIKERFLKSISCDVERA